MTAQLITDSLDEMSDKDFLRLADVIRDVLGIKMPLSKKMMLQSRLIRRLRQLGLSSYREYCDHVLEPSNRKGELTHLLDIATTNKTSFFRESEHFDYLAQYGLPDLVRRPEVAATRRILVWSAACSSGQEPYTLAMVIANYFAEHGLQDWDFQIRATDISTRVLTAGKQGVYSENDVHDIPMNFRSKFLLRGKGDRRGTIRIIPELRSKIHFERVNLTEPVHAPQASFHLAMCRNALIYFEREDQKRIVDNIRRHVVPYGYVMLGLSESIHGYGLPLNAVGRSIYRPATMSVVS